MKATGKFIALIISVNTITSAFFSLNSVSAEICTEWPNYDFKYSDNYNDYYILLGDENEGITHTVAKNYSYVVITFDNIDNGETVSELSGDIINDKFFYELNENQVAYYFSAKTDYNKLYDAGGVKKVELIKIHEVSDCYSDVTVNSGDNWFEANGIDIENKPDIFMSNIVSDADLSEELLSSYGIDVMHMYRETDINDHKVWRAYYKSSGLKEAHDNFDMKVAGVEGVISSSVSVATNFSSSILTDISEIGKNNQADINNDGKIDLTDLSELSLILVDNKTLTDEQFNSADLDGDGNVTLADLARLKQYLSKVITSL